MRNAEIVRAAPWPTHVIADIVVFIFIVIVIFGAVNITLGFFTAGLASFIVYHIAAFWNAYVHVDISIIVGNPSMVIGCSTFTSSPLLAVKSSFSLATTPAARLLWCGQAVLIEQCGCCKLQRGSAIAVLKA